MPLLIANGADVHVITRARRMPSRRSTKSPSRCVNTVTATSRVPGTRSPPPTTAVNAAVVAEAERRQIFCVRADIAVEGTAVTPASFEYDGPRSACSPAASTAVGDQPVGDPRGPATGPDRPRRPGELSTLSRCGPRRWGPGNPELITVRGRRLLAHADVVVADRLAPPELLAELPPHVEVIDAAKIPYGRSMAQDAINAMLVDPAKAGKFVVRLKGGDPFVFARGYEEVLACAEAGIPVTVVPGVTSAIAVPASAGVPVTHRA